MRFGIRSRCESRRQSRLLRKSLSRTHWRRHTLRPLPKAAAMLILARQTAGRNLGQSRIFGAARRADFRAASMPRRHHVMVKSPMLSDFSR